MAWNSTYESRAGLFTLTFVSPQDSRVQYQYTFDATISFTLDRNLTDTLSKFSLDVVDDGSKDFHGLENIVLSGITGIRVSYGVGTDNQISWSGFIYDYTSTFFGQKVKLTLIGYLTLCSNHLDDIAEHYYRLDWSPMVPYRTDFTHPWTLFQTSDYVWQRDSDNAEITKLKEEDFLNSYETAYEDAVHNDAKYLNDVPFKLDPTHSTTDLEEAIRKYIESNKKEKPSVYYGSWIYDITWVDENGYIYSSLKTWNELQEAKKRYQLYESLYDAYFSRYKKGNFSINLDISKLNNVVFSVFPSNFNSTRQIYLPVPDIFIQWDGILPKPAYVDNKWEINYDSLLGTLNDITAFGLKCTLVPSSVDNSDSTKEPTVILDGVKDSDGNVRVLKMNNATYISVSDAKAVAEKRWGKMSGEADFSEAASTASTVSTVTKQEMNSTAKQIYNYFKSCGYSDAACAGILGNIKCESGFVAKRIEGDFKNTYTYDEAIKKVDEGYQISYKDSSGNTKYRDPGYGLCQWTGLRKIAYNPNGNRVQKVVGDRSEVTVQCNILRVDIEGGNWNISESYRSLLPDYADLTIEEFKSSNDVQATSRAFMMKFERPANQSAEAQQKRASECSSLLNDIQGFSEVSSTTKIASNTVVPKTWYRTYYNYCLSAYRSALPLQYGGVYISEIVEKLCKIEGWKAEVTPTTWTSFESIQNELVMNGRNALDYIVNVLAPIATSESGYTGYVVKLESGTLSFKPAVPDKLGTLQIKMGYNIPNSPVIAFSCKTRGNLIMYGVAEEVSTVTNYSNESSVLQTYTKSESFIESKFSSKSTTQGSNWFSKGLFSYYGFLNTLEGYNSFFTTFYSSDFYYGNQSLSKDYKKAAQNGAIGGAIQGFISGGIGGGIAGGILGGLIGAAKEYASTGSSLVINASLGNSLVRSTPYSSMGGDGIEVLDDLTKFERASIKAELTIIGDNRISPNSYIEVVNMTVRGRHYTSGVYWINKVTDSFSKGTWTQKLECNRYDSNVDFFNRTASSTVSKVDNSISDLVDGVIKSNISIEEVDRKLKEYQKNG